MRAEGRKSHEIRALEFIRGYLPQAEGSCFVKMGDTWVVCTASVEERIPAWLKGSGHGWITAEYSMLPRSTGTRSQREASAGRIGGRTHEIQRIIGRSLRAVVDVSSLPELTITLDCDVVRADGGTRMAAVNGAFIALYDALAWLKDKNRLEEMPLSAFVAGVSVGVVGGEVLVDLDYSEDCGAEVDLNLVMTDAGGIIELQGTAEKEPFSRDLLDNMLNLGESAIEKIIEMQRSVIYKGLAGG